MWNDFLAVPSNKQDLALLLSNELVAQAPGDKIIVVAGGFRTAEDTQCTGPLVDIEMPRANHEEADTKDLGGVTLHSCWDWRRRCGSTTPTFCCYLLSSSPAWSATSCGWRHARPSRRSTFLSIHEIRQKLSFPESVYSTQLFLLSTQ